MNNTLEEYPTLEPGTKAFIEYDRIYGAQKTTQDKNGKSWIRCTIVTTWQPVFFPGYDVRLPSGLKMPVYATRLKLRLNQ